MMYATLSSVLRCVAAGSPSVSGRTAVRHMSGAMAHSMESSSTDRLPCTAIRPCNREV
ncbi:hypothetical protein DPMN_155463 [Dreissena polymorpha]|uniref:Uncharacterized protein n=1 Tax=Dreissena polymorpha TaxID=45954 RepID=A0A9D4J6N3_DREPO|nr:hypothetical protein DPMN_155463 [Dreissena polymorpha]